MGKYILDGKRIRSEKEDDAKVLWESMTKGTKVIVEVLVPDGFGTLTQHRLFQGSAVSMEFLPGQCVPGIIKFSESKGDEVFLYVSFNEHLDPKYIKGIRERAALQSKGE